MKLFKQTYNLNYFIFIITLSTLLFSIQEDENLLNLAKEKLKNVFTTLQNKSNLAPIKLDDISEGILVVPDYESGFMQPMPNLNTSINVEIEGMIASTTVNQMYTNDTDEILETIYIFPLPPNAVVRDMEMIIGDRHIQGVVEEKQYAKKKYEIAKSKGKRASLTKQERPNIFTNSIANVMPGDVIIIKLKLVEKLQYEDGKFSFRFPLVVGPRFIPGNKITGYSGNGWAFDTNIVPDASKITPAVIPKGMRTGNDVNISILLNAGLPIEKIESITHKISSSEIEKNRFNISLINKKIIPNKDFILEYKIKSDKEPQAALFTSKHEGDDYFMLLAMPPDQSEEIESIDKELIFILDISGSMQGKKIIQAKASLIHALKRLQKNDSFNILAFNNRNILFSKDPLKATYININQGIDFVNKLNAGGGTMAQPALKTGCELNSSNNKVKMIVFITDGAVGNENQLFNLIDLKLGKSRLFTVAIGSAPNGFLLEKISELGKGSFTYIPNNSQVEEKMTDLFSKIENPVLTDMMFELPIKSEIYPNKIPDLFKGQPLTVIGKLEESKNINATISGKSNKGQFNLEIPLKINNSKDTPGIPTLWAKSKIKNLMDDYRKGNKDVKDKIIKIAKSFKIVTQFTSFIAIEEEIINPLLAYNTRIMPTEMPEGWNYESVFGNKKTQKLAIANKKVSENAIGLPGQINKIFKRNNSLPSGSTSHPLYLISGIIFITISLFIRKLF